MSRRRAAEKREILPDAKYGDKVITKFMNSLMLDGKKSLAEGIFYGALSGAHQKAGKPEIELFHEAIDNVKPKMQVRSRRVGGATYQVPMEVRPERAQALSIRWVIEAARKRSEKTMTERLAGEFLDALQKRGSAIKKREDTHKMAEANRAFAHFRW